MATKTITVPEEGLKVVCIAGQTAEGNAVWRTVGLLTFAKSGKPMLMLDRTFNPAGVYTDKPESSAAILNLFEFSPQELQQRQQNRAVQQQSQQQRQKHQSHRGSFDDMDDDIPF